MLYWVNLVICWGAKPTVRLTLHMGRTCAGSQSVAIGVSYIRKWNVVTDYCQCFLSRIGLYITLNRDERHAMIEINAKFVLAWGREGWVVRGLYNFRYHCLILIGNWKKREGGSKCGRNVHFYSGKWNLKNAIFVISIWLLIRQSNTTGYCVYVITKCCISISWLVACVWIRVIHYSKTIWFLH